VDEGSPPARPRILVVDDEDLVRLVVAKTLERGGFEVIAARDGLDALAQIAAAPPDLVLTDLNMPRCDGEQLCLAIKRQPATAGIHVVLMTGGPLDETQMRQMGCAAVIYKPLPDRLAELLSTILRGHSLPSRPGMWTVPGDQRRGASDRG
jgi:chemosensory pili system protein ChpA (sensor histidine kinase/response regulator)